MQKGKVESNFFPNNYSDYYITTCLLSSEAVKAPSLLRSSKGAHREISTTSLHHEFLRIASSPFENLWKNGWCSHNHAQLSYSVHIFQNFSNVHEDHITPFLNYLKIVKMAILNEFWKCTYCPTDVKPEGLEGLLKFGMSKSHHITIRQQISFAALRSSLRNK